MHKLVTQSLELIEHQSVSLLVNLRFNVIQIFKESLLAVNHCILGSFCFHFFLKLFDFLVKRRSHFVDFIELSNEIFLHLVDRAIDGFELLLAGTASLFLSWGLRAIL